MAGSVEVKVVLQLCYDIQGRKILFVSDSSRSRAVYKLTKGKEIG